ncbi:MAG: hypothetical protein ACREV4_06060 [Gammaproteobacteria bacterium]
MDKNSNLVPQAISINLPAQGVGGQYVLGGELLGGKALALRRGL